MASMVCFVGIELRLRGDNAQDARNKLSRQCFKIAADDAKATQEGDEVGWSTSGGVVGGCGKSPHSSGFHEERWRAQKSTREEVLKCGLRAKKEYMSLRFTSSIGR